MFDEWGSYGGYRGQKNLYATTATQWSSMCGERIIREYELKSVIQYILDNYTMYNPRNFILSRVSDINAIQNIIKRLDTGLNNI